jgi:hypothetical protein
MIKRTEVLEIIPTPQELAECFCDMDYNEQALFFKCVGENIEKIWENGINSFRFQTSYIVESEFCTETALSVMKILGEYASENLR